MRISDWSSDVCSSDLLGHGGRPPATVASHRAARGVTGGECGVNRGQTRLNIRRHFARASRPAHAAHASHRQRGGMNDRSSDRDQRDPYQWDVVVVGASFSGAACALAARRAGLRVCVLERKRDPGIRLHTTGIIVGEAAEGTPLGLMPAALSRRVEGVRLYAPNLRSLSLRSEEHTSELQSLMRISYAVFCLKKKK